MTTTRRSDWSDVGVAGLIGWEVLSAVVPEIPPPSVLMRHRPRWERWLFAGLVAVAVIVHLDALPWAELDLLEDTWTR